MGTSNINWGITFTAGEALDTAGHEGVAIAIADGKVANNGKEASGILMSKPASGEHGTLGFGVCKFRAGLACSKGDRIGAVTSGYFTPAASGDHVNGQALEAVTSGSLGKGLFLHFPGLTYQVSSL